MSSSSKLGNWAISGRVECKGAYRGIRDEFEEIVVEGPAVLWPTATGPASSPFSSKTGTSELPSRELRMAAFAGNFGSIDSVSRYQALRVIWLVESSTPTIPSARVSLEQQPKNDWTCVSWTDWTRKEAHSSVSEAASLVTIEASKVSIKAESLRHVGRMWRALRASSLASLVASSQIPRDNQPKLQFRSHRQFHRWRPWAPAESARFVRNWRHRNWSIAWCNQWSADWD